MNPVFKSLPFWCYQGIEDKKPSIPCNQYTEAKPLEEVEIPPDSIACFLLPDAEHSNICIIDIDWPGPKKEKLEKAKEIKEANVLLGSDDHSWIINDLYKSIEGTFLDTLIESTYCEFSISGTGLHFAFLLEGKENVAGAKKDAKKGTGVSGHIALKSTAIGITGKMHPDSPNTLATLTIDQVKELFPLRLLKDKPEPEEVKPIELDETLPALADIRRAMQDIPIIPNERVIAFWEEVTECEFQAYTYWLTVGMALHNYGTITGNVANCYQIYLTWSQQDQEKYQGEDDVFSTWSSFSAEPEQGAITYRTLLRLASICAIKYPYLRKDRGMNRLVPRVDETANLYELLHHYNLELYETYENYYLTGDRGICESIMLAHGARCWFEKFYGPYSVRALESRVMKLCQTNGWRGVSSVSNLVKAWVHDPHKSFDLFNEWLSVPFEDLDDDFRYGYDRTGKKILYSDYDEISTIEEVLDCIEYDYERDEDIQLARSLVKKTFMSIVKLHIGIELPFDGNGGMLILIGDENTYKTTFVNLMLPRPLSILRMELTGDIGSEKNLRDLQRGLSNKVIIQADEFEANVRLDKDSATLKKILTSNDDSMTDIFQTTETRRKRSAVIIGTTNERQHRIPDTGSRRLWIVRIRKCDTDRFSKLNLHKIYNELYEEFRQEIAKGNTPWLLTDAERLHLEKMNSVYKSKNTYQYWLEERYPLNDPFDPALLDEISVRSSPLLKTTKEIAQEFAIDNGAFSGQANLIPGMEQTLKRYLGAWTNTLNSRVSLGSKAFIHHGKVMSTQTNSYGKPKYSKWYLPKGEDDD